MQFDAASTPSHWPCLHSPTLAPRSGEAAVTQGGKEVNRLFKADFFGERALLSNEPRGATVAAVQETVCLTLDRTTFVELLGPLDATMKASWP
jgi:cGMP-dependent protein kinase 2